MINLRKSLKNIFKITTLLGIKEGYLLTRNLYGMTEHPKLTISRIVRKRDLSQGILIFGLPVGLWLGWIFILLVSRFFIQPVGGQVFGRLQFGFLAKASFLASTLVVSLCYLLLVYFFCLVLERRRRVKWDAKGE